MSNNAQSQQQKHQQRQAKLKEQVDERIAKATIEKGLVLVITGNGKGKSTSGFGTVARAVGHGLSASVVQFIKGGWECGERNLLQQHGVDFHVMATGFTWETQNKEQDTQAAQATWLAAKKLLADDSIDMVLLDEITYMISYHYIDIDEVIEAIEQRPVNQHVIITGRNCHRRLIDLADTVSEVQSVKHAFDNGIKAQAGLDW
ncbi:MULTISPECIES: cob(I)yrinic acid a,c-diamide adenosyltransferase [unclassified Thalassotalea]|uniref:cob(I)yrinic acid a,c-diamide adenosyltransferase n=1 Tax=unclassified Thalassotalea TaxID=2614972 RepID=UPI0010808715|nr:MULTISPECIES: cob(I)yrinic acid a,c-diamide adenosyltransferase [unclassified Thalassotalea]NMP17917.1 cob(I)yrinic acid a,c-diamide adenosyltransferase [Thalassotalea sp. Y01]QBY05682.1 cob(I)yrinic acid a,c-diamide adenosyltransferase [Thalassotalea sp. HSM 43]